MCCRWDLSPSLSICPALPSTVSGPQNALSPCLLNEWTRICCVDGLCSDQAQAGSYYMQIRMFPPQPWALTQSPSGAFCLQAAGNPSRKFTINGSIEKKIQVQNAAPWRPRGSLESRCAAPGRESRSHLAVSAIRLGARTPGARPGECVTLVGKATEKGRAQLWQVQLSHKKLLSGQWSWPKRLITYLTLRETIPLSEPTLWARIFFLRHCAPVIQQDTFCK